MPKAPSDTLLSKFRTALVTGAGGTIGRAICEAFAREGIRVLAADADLHAASQTALAIQAEQGADSCHPALLEVRSAASFATVVQGLLQRWGRLDILVNNAGVTQPGRPFTADVREDLFDHIVGVNLKGAWLGMKTAIPHLQPGGCIVNMASVQGLVGLPGVAIYSATKHALLGLTQSAALEYGTLGIRVNAICPGRMDAPMRNSVDTPQAPVERDRLTRLRQPASQRATRADEIASAAVFLCSAEASFIHGIALPVDGGNTAQ